MERDSFGWLGSGILTKGKGTGISLIDADGEAFLELVKIQGDNQMITKRDLLERLKDSGMSVGERQLATYINERVVPKSARLGSRNGLFPELTVDLVAFVSSARAAQVSFGAIRELIPLWQYLKRSVLHEPYEIELAELEKVARQHVTSREAACAVPWMVPGTLGATLKNRPRSTLVIRKDGKPISDLNPPVVSFVVVELDEQDRSRAYPAVQLEVVLPVPHLSHLNPAKVIVGAPLDAEIVER